jgi:lactoylglutathione lyase
MELYETHLQVHDVERSVDFYKSLGLIFGYRNQRAAFMWVNESKNQTIGLWPCPKEQPIQRRHFAFQVELDELLTAKKRLKELNINVIGSQGKENIEPIVQAWIPAASVYFEDPDGNKLEFIAMLDEKPKKLSFVPYLSEWLALQD